MFNKSTDIPLVVFFFTLNCCYLVSFFHFTKRQQALQHSCFSTHSPVGIFETSIDVYNCAIIFIFFFV